MFISLSLTTWNRIIYQWGHPWGDSFFLPRHPWLPIACHWKIPPSALSCWQVSPLCTSSLRIILSKHHGCTFSIISKRNYLTAFFQSSRSSIIPAPLSMISLMSFGCGTFICGCIILGFVFPYTSCEFQGCPLSARNLLDKEWELHLSVSIRIIM